MSKYNPEEEHSTEQIRNRMVRNAARLWGVESDEIESSFDPLVTMLIEATAFELNKINREMISSRSRIMGRLAQTLSPETLSGAMPAYTIAYARPIDKDTIVDPETQLSTLIKKHAADIDKKEIEKEIFFSPAGNYKLFDAVVRYSVSGSRLYEYKNPNSKQLLAEAIVGSYEPHVVWLGIELNREINSLDGFLFHFDWKNDPDESKYVKILPMTRWSVGSCKLDVKQGFHQQIKNLTGAYDLIEREYDVTNSVEDFVNEYYNDGFFTIKGAGSDSFNLQDSLMDFPKELSGGFPSSVLSKINDRILWLKLKFNTAMPVNAIDDLYITMNAFPVINRRVNKITYQLKSVLNIIPLNTDTHYHDIISMNSTTGESYSANPLNSGDDIKEGYYIIRNEGLERFDERHANEHLKNMLDLLRDESAAFTSLGNEFINIQINQINQSISMIENRLDTHGSENRPTHFAIVKPFKPNDTVFVKYWTTDSVDAHGVKPSSKLSLQSGADLRSDQILTITSTTGGRLPMRDKEKITAYRRALLTRNRLLTEQDIYIFCLSELGEMVNKIEVSSNWSFPSSRKSGLMKVIEVKLTPSRRENSNESEWDDLASSLELRIKKHTSELIPVKVTIQYPVNE